MGFLDQLFGRSPRHRLCGYWCATEVKLSRTITTPLGGKVSVVHICVDIDYDIRDGTIAIARVRMAAAGSSIMGSDQAVNMAAPRRGEAWCDHGTIPAAALANIVRDELRMQGSPLERQLRAVVSQDIAG